jgi:hypothetical protein
LLFIPNLNARKKVSGFKTAHMKRRIFTFLFTSVNVVSFAQNKANKDLRPFTKLDLGLQGVGITFERRLGNSSDIELSTGIGTGGYDISEKSLTYIVDPSNPTGYISITPKIYYNRNKRLAKGKPGELNGGNYFGLRIKYATRGIAEDTQVWDALLFNLHWGLQRAVGKRWTINSHFGLGYAMDAVDLNNTSGTIYPALDLKFSYILNKKRS